MLDNYDSFTFNLVQYFGELGEEVQVFRNDQISLEQIEDLKPTYIVISPGPCSPDKAGLSMQVIDHFKEVVPILGVCLGHQSIAQVFGAKIIATNKIMHGKTSEIYHHQNSLFTGLSNPFTATRYHSLVVEHDSLPDCLEVTAWVQNEHGQEDEIMGFRHKSLPLCGVQFHPESIMTVVGHDILRNFLNQV